MLKELSQLTIDADGRYATSQELKFIRDYISSAQHRVKIYQTIREFRQTIAIETEQQILSVDEDIFVSDGKDCKTVFHRDQSISLRYTAATVLSGDLERLKQSLLLWTRTIIAAAKPVKCKNLTEMVYKIKAKVILSKLAAEEHQYIKPILALNRSILGSY